MSGRLGSGLPIYSMRIQLRLGIGNFLNLIFEKDLVRKFADFALKNASLNRRRTCRSETLLNHPRQSNFLILNCVF